MVEIEFQGINKVYNPGLFKEKVTAVINLSFGVQRGEVFGLVGPNGAGKSTTIRMLLGLIRPDAGMITFQGRTLSEISIQEEIGYLPENPYLYDHLTLEELLAFSGRASDISPQKIHRRGSELMELLSMTDARKRPLRTYSKGMLQRAGICFALLHDPSVVVLDEPMSGLDPVGRKMVFDLVTDLKKQGKTIFFCSHILTDVERLCDRIGFMMGGRLLRTFSHREFAENDGPCLHFEVEKLEELQIVALRPFIMAVTKLDDRHVLSFPTDALADVAERLHKMEVTIFASRSDRLSLEEIFMQAMEDNR